MHLLIRLFYGKTFFSKVKKYSAFSFYLGVLFLYILGLDPKQTTNGKYTFTEKKRKVTYIRVSNNTKNSLVMNNTNEKTVNYKKMLKVQEKSNVFSVK